MFCCFLRLEFFLNFPNETNILSFFSYALSSAYDQKPQMGMRPSNPPTPSSTPVSPLHHASPNSTHTPKPDHAFPAHLPPSQSMQDSRYPMDHRYIANTVFVKIVFSIRGRASVTNS